MKSPVRLLVFVLVSILLPTSVVRAVDALASAFVSDEALPYGVATIELPLVTPVIGREIEPLTVSDTAGRVLFPVGATVEVPLVPPSERPVPQPGNGRLLGRIGKLIKEITNADDMPKTQVVGRRVSFLFKGRKPVRVRVSDASGELGVYEVQPKQDPIAFRKDLSGWWQAYSSHAKSQIDGGDYPPWVETYLVAMLSGRTGNGLPQWFVEPTPQDDPLMATLKYLGGGEDVAKEVFRRTAAGLTDDNRAQTGRDVAMTRLPAGPRWKQTTLPPVQEDVDTEPIASRVPPECFYIRFGSFTNYLWFVDLSDEYGGDLGRMITLRGTATKSTERFEQQLSVQMNQLSRMLGPTIIEDQALIGSDLFTADGATMGVMMKATNSFLLRSSLSNERKTRARNDDAVTLKDVTIAGKKVSLLSSADNRVRSFLAEDNGYFLITNSETLARRFFEVGADGQSLAKSEAFRLSRMLVPTDREDTIFAYFSPEMLQGLVSPKYLIELRRRVSAKSEIALVHLARLAAQAEGALGDNAATAGVEDLIDKGYLPVSFGNRGDGSGVFSIGDDVLDTMRGRRGTFLPIGDVQIEDVTAEEAAWYTKIAQEYSTRFPQMDPIILALRREDVAADKSLERISIHAEIAPLTPEKYGDWAKQLGPPTTVSVRSAPDDIVSLQAHVASEQIGPPTHLFVGIKDTFPPAPEEFEGLLNAYRSLRQLPGYLGAWPQPGALDRLPLGLGRGRPVGPGMSRLLGGLYRYTGGGFSVLSFQPDVLESSLPFLEAIEAAEPATVRGRVGSLLGSQLEGWVNDQLYQRAARSSQAGAEFLDLLCEQLRVAPEDALETAALVIDDPLQCSLGGEYKFDTTSHRWISTAWGGTLPSPNPPGGYIAPLLHWFRGGEFKMTQYSDRLVADAVITVARDK
ncbi:MAG: hypothetical protein AAFX06_21965 [Planctomycetota bacterium]